MKFGVIISVLCCSILLFTEITGAQELSGSWKGELNIQGQKLPLIFNFKTSDNGEISGTIDSPLQGAKDIKISSITLTDNLITVNSKVIMATYKGEVDFSANSIKGTFYQAGMELPLVLKKSDKDEGIKRPQMPKEPFGYIIEEVMFENFDNAEVKLAGTLTIPKGTGPFPVAVMVTGSGPQDRDETLVGHKPFWVIADHLTKKGIAVLRYDDRGFGKSKGNFTEATTVDFAYDAISAVSFLKKDSRFSEIGIIGHSEGGLVAPMAATQSDDINFIVMLAGLGISGREILIRQVKLITAAEGGSEEKVKLRGKQQEKLLDLAVAEKPDSVKKKEISKLLKEMMNFDSMSEEVKNNAEMSIFAQANQLIGPWFQFFITFDPYETLTEVECPVLAINGSKDVQVPAEINLKMIKQALDEGGNNKYKIVKLEGLNHLFQNCKTGAVSEYALIEETFDPSTLDLITNWIKENTGK